MRYRPVVILVNARQVALNKYNQVVIEMLKTVVHQMVL